MSMSKLSDYSKFDRLRDGSDDDDDELDGVQQGNVESNAAVVSAPVAATGVHRRHPVTANRFIFEYDNAAVYEWEQSLSEVILYVPVPPVKGKFACTISAHHLQLGLLGASQFFFDEDTFGSVDTAESTWCLEEDNDRNVIAIYLHKAAKGVVWEVPLKGKYASVLDSISLQQVQKELMLERWQEENPGMDFRGAEFNGCAPDPRTYMGGVQYD